MIIHKTKILLIASAVIFLSFNVQAQYDPSLDHFNAAAGDPYSNQTKPDMETHTQLQNTDELLQRLDNEIEPLTHFSTHVKNFESKISRLEQEKQAVQKRLDSLQAERNDLYEANMAKTLLIDVLEHKLEKEEYALKTLIKLQLEKNRAFKAHFKDIEGDVDLSINAFDLGDYVYVNNGVVTDISRELIDREIKLAKDQYSLLNRTDELIDLHEAIEYYKAVVDDREEVLEKKYFLGHSIRKRLRSTDLKLQNAHDRLNVIMLPLE